MKKLAPGEPVVHIDDSDVVKTDISKFESLGIVRGGPESTSAKNVSQTGRLETGLCDPPEI